MLGARKRHALCLLPPPTRTSAHAHRPTRAWARPAGHADWGATFARHGWYFSIQPFFGLAIHAYKTYQFNHLVSATDVAYPRLWVSPGSAATPLGRTLGMDADFVTGARLAGG